jgi:hypothetical protein
VVAGGAQRLNPPAVVEVGASRGDPGVEEEGGAPGRLRGRIPGRGEDPRAVGAWDRDLFERRQSRQWRRLGRARQVG